MTRRLDSYKIGTLLSLSVGVVFVIAAVITIAVVNHDMRQQALVEAEAKMRIILDRNMALHTYFSRIMKPNLFEYTEPFRSPDYFDPSWMSSTYALREIGKYFKELSPEDYYYKDAAINARSPENEADAEERTFLEELNADPSLEARSQVRNIDDKPYLVVMRPGEVMEESCLRCHGNPAQAPKELVEEYGVESSFHRQVGEIASVVSVRVPLSIAYGNADRFSLNLSVMLLSLLLALFLFQFVFNHRWLWRPLAAIQNKVREISSDERRLGEQIPVPFGQELYDLTAAFNQMSIALRHDRDNLEERVVERTIELKQTDKSLRVALAEKEVLLREVHHRVKNNIQAIIFLVESRIAKVTDEQTRLMLKGIQEQARAMGLVYDQLYQSGSLSEIRMEQYLNDLAANVVEAFGGGRQIELSVECTDIILGVESAMPCGLMVNELLTNALKYAFPPSFRGIPHLHISLKAQDDHYDLVVRDNGVGLPEGMEQRTQRSMGLRLVKLWATHQMGGTLEVSGGDGACYHITFPRKDG